MRSKKFIESRTELPHQQLMEEILFLLFAFCVALKQTDLLRIKKK